MDRVLPHGDGKGDMKKLAGPVLGILAAVVSTAAWADAPFRCGSKIISSGMTKGSSPG